MYTSSQNRMRMRIYNVLRDVKKDHAFYPIVTSPADSPDFKPRVNWGRFHDTVPLGDALQSTNLATSILTSNGFFFLAALLRDRVTCFPYLEIARKCSFNPVLYVMLRLCLTHWLLSVVVQRQVHASTTVKIHLLLTSLAVSSGWGMLSNSYEPRFNTCSSRI
jgi:hypothetical protein